MKTLTSTLPPTRDPDARARLGWAVLALGFLWPLLQLAEFRPWALFEGNNLQVMGAFLAGFLPPETSTDFLGILLKATLETLAIATAGMALAFLLAVPQAYLSSGAGREKATLNPLTRSLLTLLRGIPELVWALVFVRVFGLGPSAGVLVLGLTYGGMLAKVYAEILESVDPAPAQWHVIAQYYVLGQNLPSHFAYCIFEAIKQSCAVQPLFVRFFVLTWVLWC